MTLKALYILVDIRQGVPSPDDERLIECADPLTERSQGRVAVIATKIDKLPKNQQKPAIANSCQRASAPPVRSSRAARRRGRQDAFWKSMISAVV